MSREFIDFKEELNPDQYNAVTAEDRFIRVIAGAGSGKTRVLTYRLAYLVRVKQVRANDILCITFTNRATDEMRERIGEMLLFPPSTVMTFNGLGNRIVKQEIHRIGWEDGSKLLATEGEQISVVKEILDVYHLEDTDQPEETEQIGETDGSQEYANRKRISIRIIMNKIARRKRELGYLKYLIKGEETDIDDCIEQARKSKHQEAPKGNRRKNKAEDDFIFFMYLKLQAERKFLDFSDQVCLPLMMFEKYPDMKETWSKRYKYIMVDEFQDVSDTNYKLCEILAGESNHLFVVGDSDQMIYGWRDASPEYLENFAEAHKNTRSFDLLTNYRSTSEIVRVANRLIAFNTMRRDKHEMIPYETGEAPKVQYFHVGFQGEDEEKTEEEAIVERINELLRNGIKGKDIAILYRNHFCSNMVKIALEEAEIPYKEFKDDDLFDMPVIEKALSLMKLAVWQDDATFELFKECFSDSIGSELLEEIYAQEDDEPLYQRIISIVEEGDEDYPELEKLLNVIKKANIMNKNGTCVTEIFDFIMENSGLNDEVEKYRFREEEESINELENRIGMIYRKVGDKLDLGECLKYLEAGDDTEADDCIRLSTIHTAKGLEFDYVFLIHMTDKVLPSHKVANFRSLEEERRLAYVAFTRAKKRLWISDDSACADSQLDEIAYLDDEYPSPFIFEAGNGVELYDLVRAQVEDEIIDEVIHETMQRSHKRTLWARLVSRGLLDKMFPCRMEVEHPIYGYGKIIGFLDDGRVQVKFDTIDPVLTILDVYKLKFVRNERNCELARDNEEINEILALTDTDDPLRKRVQSVLELIDNAAKDEEHANQVSVLSLPCGSGKSSAISLKICRVIAAYEEGSKDGLLIISHLKDQLRQYLEPADPVVRNYIQSHMNRIVRLDSDNYPSEIMKIGRVPVLIITSNRYINLDVDKLIDKYLTFNRKCKRSLIIMDEEQEFPRLGTITVKDLNDIDTAIKDGFDDQQDQEIKEFCSSLWEKYRTFLIGVINMGEKVAHDMHKDEYYNYVIGNAIHENPGFPSIGIFHRFYYYMKKNQGKLIKAFKNNKEGTPNISFLIDAVYCLMAVGGVYFFKSAKDENKDKGKNKTYEPDYVRCFYVRVYHDLFFSSEMLGSKIVVLDGTAWISPVYKHEMFHVIDDVHDFDRRLGNFSLKIVNIATGKMMMKSNEALRKMIIQEVKNYCYEIPKEEKMAIFTYMDLECEF